MADDIRTPDFSAFMASLLIGENPNRATALTDEFVADDVAIVVDTAWTLDTGRWETAIKRNDSPWVVVEQYTDASSARPDRAKDGHATWVERLHAEPLMTLTDVYKAQWSRTLLAESEGFEA